MATAEHLRKFKELAAQPAMEQAKFFLKAFVLDFQGKFEVVLDLAQQFAEFNGVGTASTTATLTEHETHLFLEKRGETLTVVQLRDYLRTIDINVFLPKVSLVEYLLWKYSKSLPQLFTPPPEGAANQELVRAFEEAMNQYLAAKEAERQRQLDIERLQGEASGKRTLASVSAKNKIDELSGQEFGNAFARLQAAKRKREAEEALAAAPKVDPYAEEQKRLERERLAREEEERRTREEARNRLKNRAALWEQK